ncbi:MAG: hypothetical protein ACJA0X_001360 [Cyclobacteriaceae bacterium]|jgi:hypothetical protein
MIIKTLLKTSIFFILISLQLHIHGQSLSKFEKYIEKEEYDKLKDVLDRSEEKDSSRIGVKYYYSKYYTTPNQSFYNLDSADRFIRKASQLYRSAAKEEIQDLEENGINQQVISAQIALINKLAFDRAIDNISITSLDDFIYRFADSKYIPEVIATRDSLAFDIAQKKPSAQAYLNYANTYPESKYQPKAKQRYDSLLFTENTDPQDLSSLETFITAYPNSPFKSQVTDQIYTLRTAEHKLKNYLDFIVDYPNSQHVRSATNYAYHLDKLSTIKAVSELDIIDSLKATYRLEEGPWYAFSQSGDIQFFDTSGNTQLDKGFLEITEDVKCNGLAHAVFVAKTVKGEWNIYNRAGILLVDNVVPSSLQVIDQQVFIVKKNGKLSAFHLSGKLITEEFEQLTVINRKWLLQISGTKKSLLNFQGEVFQTAFDEVKVEGVFYIFKIQSENYVLNDPSVLSKVNFKEANDRIQFDDFEYSNGHLILFKGNSEALLDSHLDFKVEWGNHKVYNEFDQWIAETDKSISIVNEASNTATTKYSKIASNDGWIALKKGGSWFLNSRENLNIALEKLTSVTLINRHCAQVEEENDNYLLFQNGNKYSLSAGVSAKKLPAAQNIPYQFFEVIEGAKKLILDSVGNVYSLGNFEGLYVLSDSLFRFSQNEKIGIINLAGELVLEPVYDIAEKDKSLIYLLSKALLGAYDITKKVLLKPSYSQKIERLGNGYLAKEGDKYLWLDKDGSNQLSQNYGEIKSWNDTAVWVKEANNWALIDKNDSIITSGISMYQKISTDGSSDVYKVLKNGKHALFSKEKGQLSDFIFDNVALIGNQLIMAEQQLSLAEFVVVIYFDITGKKITSKAYNSQFFGQISCD